ncbi:DMT family transporter [Streptomyces sp. G45]|uniref:DMT family transporter n=1 Tax=Streptomyces sp. G45 TaxID=3406627 RepID=UPI003C289B21
MRRTTAQERTNTSAGTGTARRTADDGRAARPFWGVATGAVTLGVAPVLLDLSKASAATASFFRCVIALPFLALLAVPERRREGAPTRHQHGTAALAGLLFAGDMLLWTQSIGEVGAGLSTVLVNVQVVLVPLLAWAVDREPVPRRFLCWLPVLAVGVVLTGGVVGGGGTGSDPAAGTLHAVLAALCYSGFLFLLRRGGGGGHARQTYTVVTLAAATGSLLAGLLWYGVDLAPAAPTLGWLAGAAFTSGVVGWLLVAVHSPGLPSHIGAILLLLTPVAALALSAAALGERPGPLQIAGCAVLLAGAYGATAGARGAGARPGAHPGRERP